MNTLSAHNEPKAPLQGTPPFVNTTASCLWPCLYQTPFLLRTEGPCILAPEVGQEAEARSDCREYSAGLRGPRCGTCSRDVTRGGAVTSREATRGFHPAPNARRGR